LKGSSLAKIAVINALLLILAYLVYQDLSSRDAYAHELAFSPSTSFSLFSRVFSLTGRGTILVSPLTLDWPQVLILALIVFDIYSLLGILLRRKPSIS